MKKLAVALDIFVPSLFSAPLFLFVQHVDDGVRLIPTLCPLVSSLCIILLCILFDLPIGEEKDKVNVILFWQFYDKYCLLVEIERWFNFTYQGPHTSFPNAQYLTLYGFSCPLARRRLAQYVSLSELQYSTQARAITHKQTFSN